VGEDWREGKGEEREDTRAVPRTSMNLRAGLIAAGSAAEV